MFWLGVGIVECVGVDNGIVYVIEVVFYFVYYGSLIVEVINIRIDFGKFYFFLYFIEFGYYLFG